MLIPFPAVLSLRKSHYRELFMSQDHDQIGALAPQGTDAEFHVVEMSVSWRQPASLTFPQAAYETRVRNQGHDRTALFAEQGGRSFRRGDSAQYDEGGFWCNQRGQSPACPCSSGKAGSRSEKVFLAASESGRATRLHYSPTVRVVRCAITT